MTANPTPEEIRAATFRVVFRGYDQAEIQAYLDRVAQLVSELEVERQGLASRLGEFADRDLRGEFEKVGAEVTSVLEAAREAAQTMRDRASSDAARWRSEALTEAEATRREASSDAEALRSDAWTTGSQLLEQVQGEVQRQYASAERESLSVLGEAERESHRLTSGSRREAEELVRNARMEADKLVGDARSEHDDIIASAHRRAESAQERTRALEQRRDELMTELESVRSALSSFENELEGKRQGTDTLEEATHPQRVVMPDESGVPHVENWEDGGTVRVIHPSKPESADEDEPNAEDLAAEVERLRETETAEAIDEVAAEDSTDVQDVADAVMPSEAPEEPIVEEPVSTEAGESQDDLSELFRRLRGPSEAAAGSPEKQPGGDEPKVDAGEEEEAVEPEQLVEPAAGLLDPFELRERLLLPVTNTALRSVKRTLTDAQNDALDLIRVNQGEWMPVGDVFEAAMGPHLEELVGDALVAGYGAASEYGVDDPTGGDEVDLPDVATLPADLVASLGTALEHAGPGPRERSAAASRVFRGWRTDEAERRIRFLALTAYHSGLRQGLDGAGRSWEWTSHGRLCPQCRTAAGSGRDVPPAHRDCDCTIVPA